MNWMGNLRLCFSGLAKTKRLACALFACLALSAACFSGSNQHLSEEKALGQLISEYFNSWSKSDMQAYRSCFHPKASVYFIDGSGDPHHYQLGEFIAGQEKAHKTFPEPISERPTHTSIAVRGGLAQAEVRWELHAGNARSAGTDYFTFIKTDAGWKILSLIFEQDPK